MIANITIQFSIDTSNATNAEYQTDEGGRNIAEDILDQSVLVPLIDAGVILAEPSIVVTQT